jgi:pyrroline-5-carboxylate reductase
VLRSTALAATLLGATGCVVWLAEAEVRAAAAVAGTALRSSGLVIFSSVADAADNQGTRSGKSIHSILRCNQFGFLEVESFEKDD